MQRRARQHKQREHKQRAADGVKTPETGLAILLNASMAWTYDATSAPSWVCQLVTREPSSGTASLHAPLRSTGLQSERWPWPWRQVRDWFLINSHTAQWVASLTFVAGHTVPCPDTAACMRSSHPSSTSSSSGRSSRRSRQPHDVGPPTNTIVATVSPPVTSAAVFALDAAALSHRISIADSSAEHISAADASRSGSNRSLADEEELSRSSSGGGSHISSTKHKRSSSVRSSTSSGGGGRSRDKGSGTRRSRRGDTNDDVTAAARIRIVLRSVRSLCDCSSRTASSEKSDGSSGRRGLRRLLRWQLAIGAGVLWLVAMWLALVYCPDASTESELDSRSRLCTISAPIRALVAILASHFSTTARRSSEIHSAAVTGAAQLVSKRQSHRAERVQLNPPASTAEEQPLIPGTTPFTILSLLRDMPSESELQSLKSSMASRAYQDQLFQYAVQWNALVSWTQIVRPRHIIVFMDTEESCRKLVSRGGFEGRSESDGRQTDHARVRGFGLIC